MVDGIKTPEQPEPDMMDPAVFAAKFEELNKDMDLNFTRSVMEGLYELLDDIAVIHMKEQGVDLHTTFVWSSKTSELEKLDL